MDIPRYIKERIQLLRMDNNINITVSEARSLANDILCFMDINQIISILELDEGEILTDLILNGNIEADKLNAFLK